MIGLFEPVICRNGLHKGMALGALLRNSSQHPRPDKIIIQTGVYTFLYIAMKTTQRQRSVLVAICTDV